jgi:hypothetical protein
MKLISVLLTVLLTIHSVYADTPYGRMSDIQDSVNLNPWRDILIVISIVIIGSIIQARKENKSNNK